MTKNDIVDGMRQRVPAVSQKRAGEAIELLLEGIKSELTRGKTVKLHGFGNFTVRRAPGKVVRNPKTRVPVEVPPRRVVTFTPSGVLRTAMNSGSGSDEGTED